MRLRSTALLAHVALGACQGPVAESSGLTTTPGITTVPGDTSGESSSSSSSSGTTTTGDDGSGSGDNDTSTEPSRDLGDMPDFGDGKPVGCKGKIDFLFVISRGQNMLLRQEQLALAVPQFIDTIQAKFEDFDYHIMVVDGDGPTREWGVAECTAVCPNLACKESDDCCPSGNGSDEPCCPDPDYPCGLLDLVTPCDQAWGAGAVFPAGLNTADKPCPLEPGLRYIKKGEPNLDKTFECIAMIGGGGWYALGQALTAAVQPDINDIGGCNTGFLRDDALLMVTLISTGADEPNDSEGSPNEWAQAVIDAKHGDDKSVVMFDIMGGGPVCKPYDRICQMTETFPYHHHEYVMVDDYGPAFVEAVDLVETACAGFTPPG